MLIRTRNMVKTRFDLCVEKGGAIKTAKMSNNRYQRVCQLGNEKFYDKVKEKKEH